MKKYKNWIEFNDEYPSGIYRCFICGQFTTDMTVCSNCGAQANDLFRGKTVRIDNEDLVIFEPIEDISKISGNS